MDNENKKVNNANNNQQKAFDEIMDGFYDLTSLYSDSPKKKPVRSREEELRLREEKRRELEMQAIKEDIERRYSLQLETAQSNAQPAEKAEKRKPLTNLMPEIDEHETVREELERIDEIIYGPKAAEEKAEEKSNSGFFRKKRKKKEASEETVQEYYEPEEHSALYDAFYSFGDSIYRFLAVIFGFLFKVIKAPFVRIFRAFSSATENTKIRFRKSLRNTLKEAVRFRTEIKNGMKAIRKAIKKPATLPHIISHYIKAAFRLHDNLLKTTFNILLPVGALAVFILTINYWNGVTYALEVVYNDNSIGYISDESVYIEARDLVKDRLSSGAYSINTVEETVAASPAADFNARYSLKLVSIDELNDARTISDKIIENSVDNLTHACGIYIDGEFICAVKNEADAKTVFDNILAEYEEDARTNGYVVGLDETIDYVQGLYPDETRIMWDATKLSDTVNGKSMHHTLTATDTAQSVAEFYGISEEQLKSYNPGYDFESIKAGDQITVSSSDKLVSIRKTVTTTSTRDIKFETVTKRDVTKYSGYRSVTQKGVNGTERVTKTQIYIDGVLKDTDYGYETITEPVDEIITVGTKTSYNGVYIGSASKKGFLWPAPSCHYVSSAYGWRSRGWHTGIDLVKAGGGANGTPVIASRSGRVEVVQRSNSGYGNMILINHGDGYKTRYAHMITGSMTVSVGQYVEAGQTIGKVGSTGNSTGPHLHFEVIYNGETYNPANYIY